VIDGTIRSGQNFAELDPNEIESISVLKDAGSAAVYGLRAANGVIVVTTKRGKTGKPSFSLSSSVSFDKPTMYPSVMNAYQYASYQKAAAENLGTTPSFTDQQIADYKSGKTPSTNWAKVAYGNSAVTDQHNMSVSGGSDAIRYFFSLGYLDQDGIYPNLDYSRYNFRSNTDIKINKNLSAVVNIEGKVAKNTAPNISSGTLWQLANGIYPTIPAYYKDGRPAYNIIFADHPGVATTQDGYNRSNDNFLSGQLALTQQLPFIKGLSAQGSIQISREYNFSKQFTKQYPTYVEDAQGNVLETHNLGTKTTLLEDFANANTYTLDLSLNYARTFGLHSIKGLFLYEQYAANSNDLNGSRTNYPFDSIDQLFAGASDNTQFVTGSAGQDGRLSFVSRLDYDYAAKYIFEASVRSDASWRFAPNKRWGYFPSFSAGWVLSEENFMKGIKCLDFLKLRASWGITGNDIVGGFQWQNSYSLSSSNFYFSGSPVPYLQPGVVPNPDITWESTRITNIGMDATFLHKLLGITLDVFQKDTYNIYAQRVSQYPGVYGAVLPYQNYGKVNTKGFEVSLTHENTIGEVKYGISTNFSYNRNKVVLIDYPANTDPWNNPIGRPIGYYTGFVAEGLFQTNAEAASSPTYNGAKAAAGDIKYMDVNKDGVINYLDTKVLSLNNSTPAIAYGATFNVAYKGFDLSVFFQGVADRKVMYTDYTRNPLLNGNSYTYFLDYWSPTNTDAKFPRAWSGRSAENDVNSSFWLKDASFLRLKNVQLAYTVPKSMTQRWNVSSLRFFVSGSNLAVFSKVKDFDPEYPGGSGFYYPQNKSLVIGANVTF
jgi:TonB-linked SusC/RagA family outer membrane protein